MSEVAKKVPATPVATQPTKASPPSVEPSELWRPFQQLRRQIDSLFEDFGRRPMRMPFSQTPFDVEPFWRRDLFTHGMPAMDAANTYVRDADGNKVWAGNLVQDGIGMNIAAGRLGNSDLERKSLSTGLRVKGKLNIITNTPVAPKATAARTSPPPRPRARPPRWRCSGLAISTGPSRAMVHHSATSSRPR